jgi:hypothetical protein
MQLCTSPEDGRGVVHPLKSWTISSPDPIVRISLPHDLHDGADADRDDMQSTEMRLID